MDPLVPLIFVKFLILTVPAMIVGAVYFRRIRREDRERERLLHDGKLVAWPRHDEQEKAAA